LLQKRGLKCCVTTRVNEHVTVHVNTHDAGCDKRPASTSIAKRIQHAAVANVAVSERNISSGIEAHIG
jgi:hypothetical protein